MKSSNAIATMVLVPFDRCVIMPLSVKRGHSHDCAQYVKLETEDEVHILFLSQATLLSDSLSSSKLVF